MEKTLYDDWYKDYLKKRNLTEEQDKELEKKGFETLGIKKTKSIKRKLIADLVVVLGEEYRVEPLSYFDVFSVYLASSGKRIIKGRIYGHTFGSPFIGCDTPEQFKKRLESLILRNYSEQDLVHSEDDFQRKQKKARKLRDLKEEIANKWREYMKSMPVFGFEKGEFAHSFNRTIELCIDDEIIKVYREGINFVAEGLFYISKRNAKRVGRDQLMRKLLVVDATTKGGYLRSQMTKIDDTIDKLDNYEL